MLKIFLKKSCVDSKVELDGQDISRMLTGVEIGAHVGKMTTAILYYRGPVEIEGEAGRLVLRSADSMTPDRVIEATSVDDSYTR